MQLQASGKNIPLYLVIDALIKAEVGGGGGPVRDGEADAGDQLAGVD